MDYVQNKLKVFPPPFFLLNQYCLRQQEYYVIILNCLKLCVFHSCREKIGYYESVNIIKPEDAAILFKAEGHYPKRLRVEPWTAYRDFRNRKYGVLLKYDFSY